MKTFSELGLSQGFLDNLAALGFTNPTEIQAAAIPVALEGKDVIGGSATGSGKTLAFATSIIEKLEPKVRSQALIMTPTRELAEQVGKSFQKFARHTPARIAIVYGGVGMGPQVEALERAEIVVGTPGRILDHLERGSFDLKNIRTLVLDEADRMLDMGFIDDVTRIIEACPEERQTFLFSATISPDITHLAKHYMKDPVEIAMESYVDPSKLNQIYYDVPKHVKFSLLVHLLKGEHPGLVMVFCNTRHIADFLGNNLKRQGIEATAIHGGLTQARRNMIMQHFHDKKVFALICTDVAARGLDIKGVSHVYNYDIPNSSKEYVHRIGRTARAGKEGKAVSIVSDRDYDNFRNVLRDQSLRIEKQEAPQVQDIPIRMNRDRDGGFQGGRGGFRGRRGRGGFGASRGGRFGGRGRR